jgi:hypothetical protein
MKFKSLLLTAAAVALTTGQASALDLENFMAPTGSILSEDLDFASTPVAGNFPFDLTLTNGGEFPSDENLFITIRLPTGLDFPATASAASFIDAAEANVDSVSLFDRDVVNGQNQVQLLVSLNATADVEDITFDLPVEVNECPGSEDIFITAQVGDANGIFVENDTNGAALPTGLSFLSCGETKDDVVVAAGSAAGVEAGLNDVLIRLDDYVTIGLLGNVPGTRAVVGTVDFAFGDDIVIDLADSPTPITTSDLDSIEFDIVVGDATGIEDISVGGVTCDQGATPATATIFSCEFTGGDLDLLLMGDPEDVVVTVDGETELPGPNAISVTNVVCDFSDANADFVPEVIEAGGALDTLQREGQVFGFFDWNAEAGPVNSVYRVTGLSNTEDTPLTVVFENSRSGQNGSFTTVIPASEVSNGEFTMASRLLISELNPGFDRADIQFNFQTTNGLDVDRLISSNGLVTDFGGGANFTFFGGTQPLFDGDNASLTE